MKDKICQWLARKMPKRLLYFATINLEDDMKEEMLEFCR